MIKVNLQYHSSVYDTGELEHIWHVLFVGLAIILLVHLYSLVWAVSTHLTQPGMRDERALGNCPTLLLVHLYSLWVVSMHLTRTKTERYAILR
jgi:hypothetical protein